MKRISCALLVLLVFWGCTNKNSNQSNESVKLNSKTELVVDSLLYFRHHSERTNLLLQKFPELSRKKAVEIQMAMLKRELNSGAQLIGWKMAGTIANDSASYDPAFGYLLKSNMNQEGSELLLKSLPGGSINVEGEIGFVMNKDFKQGVSSEKALKNGIAYIVNAVELANVIATPSSSVSNSINFNYNIAAGAGQVGIILGSGKAKVQDFNLENETVKCFINDTLAATGISKNVYGSPLHALYSLANILPKYGIYLKKGDIVITGSVYPPPTVKKTSNIQIKSSTLGAINFSIK